MNNLTQTQTEAKNAFLTQQSEQMLKVYNIADTDERKAVASHINAFLPVVPEEAKTFWLNFLNQLEKIDAQPKVLFSLGKVYLTIGAREVLEESNQTADEFLSRHQKGDWGNVCKDDADENDLSLREGFRILSSYKTSKDEKLWIITEADRSSTTLLLPSEY